MLNFISTFVMDFFQIQGGDNVIEWSRVCDIMMIDWLIYPLKRFLAVKVM